MKIKLMIIMILLMITVAGLGNNQESEDGVVIYELSKFTISSGGGFVSGNVYSSVTSIGQIDAGHKTTGGSYEFDGGLLSSSGDLIFKNNFE